jgi:hypothetical protein
MEGAHLYQDIIEINPPLAFGLAVPPVWIANLTDISPVDVFFWIFAQIGLSILLTGAVRCVGGPIPIRSGHFRLFVLHPETPILPPASGPTTSGWRRRSA